MFKTLLKIVLLFSTLVAGKNYCFRWPVETEGGQIQLIPLTENQISEVNFCKEPSKVDPQFREECKELMEFAKKHMQSFDLDGRCDEVTCYRDAGYLVCPGQQWPWYAYALFIPFLWVLVSAVVYFAINRFSTEVDDISTSSFESDTPESINK